MEQKKTVILGIVASLIIAIGVGLALKSDNITNVNIDDSLIPQKSELKQIMMPQAIFEGPKSILVGVQADFYGDESLEPIDGYIEKWEWRINDNIVSEKSFLSYIFPKSDTYEIELTVIDNNGKLDKKIQIVKVTENAIESSPNFLDTTPSETTTYGPMEYHSFLDSPFNQFSADSVYFHLEDFEDGVLNTPNVKMKNGVVISPDEYTDSVDIDGDGLNDGDGTSGHSLYVDGHIVTFTFSDPLPNYVGMVLTDTDDVNADAHFEAYDSSGQLIERIDAKGPGDRSKRGTTDEDRFFGVFHKSGIKGMKMEVSWSEFEVDHIQYGKLK